MQELKGKVAIVTGATRKRGLGRVRFEIRPLTDFFTKPSEKERSLITDGALFHV